MVIYLHHRLKFPYWFGFQLWPARTYLQGAEISKSLHSCWHIYLVNAKVLQWLQKYWYSMEGKTIERIWKDLRLQKNKFVVRLPHKNKLSREHKIHVVSLINNYYILDHINFFLFLYKLFLIKDHNKSLSAQGRRHSTKCSQHSGRQQAQLEEAQLSSVNSTALSVETTTHTLTTIAGGR